MKVLLECGLVQHSNVHKTFWIKLPEHYVFYHLRDFKGAWSYHSTNITDTDLKELDVNFGTFYPDYDEGTLFQMHCAWDYPFDMYLIKAVQEYVNKNIFYWSDSFTIFEIFEY